MDKELLVKEILRALDADSGENYVDTKAKYIVESLLPLFDTRIEESNLQGVKWAAHQIWREDSRTAGERSLKILNAAQKRLNELSTPKEKTP